MKTNEKFVNLHAWPPFAKPDGLAVVERMLVGETETGEALLARLVAERTQSEVDGVWRLDGNLDDVALRNKRRGDNIGESARVLVPSENLWFYFTATVAA